MIEIIHTLKEIFLENPLAQIIGIIAFLVSVYNFLFCKNKKFIIVTGIASAIWGLHFLSLGLLSAAFVNLFDVIKNALSLKYERNIYWVVGLSIFYTIIGVYTYTGDLISLIPTLNAIISTYLVFYIRGIWLNVGFLGIIALWMIYNYIGNSIGGLATDIFLIGFGIIGIIRQILENNKK
ncbi:YgjV family protein [Candidatus Gracilibacteria bacterium]|nr:YgjV family protein [Candidatus Gracilibacteria bacterium]